MSSSLYVYGCDSQTLSVHSFSHLQKLATALVGHRDRVPYESVVGISPGLLGPLVWTCDQALFREQLLVDSVVDRVVAGAGELVVRG